MGMDVSGRKPSSPAGEYFRATIWSWPPILALMDELCSDFLSEKLLRKMAFNDGAGPRSQKTCTKIAQRFEQWMEQHTDGYGLESDLQVTKEGRFVRPEDLLENPDLETVSPYSVGDDHLKQWIEFLRYCGGFRVW